MKLQLFAHILAASAITLGVIPTINQPSSAQTRTYFCDTSSGVPTTVAKNVTGREIPVIRWVSDFGGQYTPTRRCQEVSARFENAYEKGLLNYLTTGIVKRQQVVCASSQYGGPCSDLLFTLKPSQNASSVIQNLVDIGYRARGPIVQSEDGSSQIYIDMNKLLREPPAQKAN